MAKVLSQQGNISLSQLEGDTRLFIEHLDNTLSENIRKGNLTLNQLVDLVYSSTPQILTQAKMTSKMETDKNGNLIVTLGGDTRIALAIGIIQRGAHVALFDRQKGEQSYDITGNINPANLDLLVAAKAILSRGSIVFKAGEGFMNLSLNELRFAGIATETTDGDGDASTIIMPVYHAGSADPYTPPEGKKVQLLTTEAVRILESHNLSGKLQTFQKSL